VEVVLSLKQEEINFHSKGKREEKINKGEKERTKKGNRGLVPPKNKKAHVREPKEKKKGLGVE